LSSHQACGASVPSTREHFQRIKAGVLPPCVSCQFANFKAFNVLKLEWWCFGAIMRIVEEIYVTEIRVQKAPVAHRSMRLGSSLD